MLVLGAQIAHREQIKIRNAPRHKPLRYVLINEDAKRHINLGSGGATQAVPPDSYAYELKCLSA